MSKQKPAPKVQPKVERAPSGARILKAPPKVWYRPSSWFNRQIRRSGSLPKARTLCMNSYKLVYLGRKQIAGLYAVYLLASLAFAKGVASSTDLASIKTVLDTVLSGLGGKLQTTTLQLTYLFSGSGSSSQNTMAGAYQTILLLVSSLALLWIFRQSLAGKPATLKQSFYSGMYPIVQTVLVLLIMLLQFLPFAIGSYMFAVFVSGDIAVGGFEVFIAFLLFAGMAIWSLRMISASTFALYIVTLPGMEPLRAIRSAKQLVAERRLMVLRKMLALFTLLLVVSSLVVVPFLFVSSLLAVWVFFAVSGTWFIVINAYLYTLYRELLNNE